MNADRFVKRVVERFAFFAPFCGILGTVYGIYYAFGLMGQLESSHVVAVLAGLALSPGTLDFTDSPQRLTLYGNAV